jgi:hypothetical protein
MDRPARRWLTIGWTVVALCALGIYLGLQRLHVPRGTAILAAVMFEVLFSLSLHGALTWWRSRVERQTLDWEFPESAS